MPAKANEVRVLPIVRLWFSYQSFVEKATRGGTGYEKDLTYWRQRLFTNFITYLLPACFIALVPGVYMSLTHGFIFIGVVDMVTVLAIALISLNSKWNLRLRKFLVMVILYCLSIMLIIDLSLLGPGIIYLLSLSVIISVTCPRSWSYATVLINLLVCIACAFVIDLKLLDTPLIADYSIGTWVAVASNLIFLSLVIVMLINNTVDGLEKMIFKEQNLKNELLIKSIEEIKSNNLLKESEENYKSLFFQSPSPMWVLDIHTLKFLQVNEAAIHCYGYSNDEFLSMQVSDIKLEKDISILHRDIQQNKEAGSPQSMITQHRRKNNEIFYAEVIFSNISFKGKDATLVISQDITTRIEYVKAINIQNEQLQEIADIQSHKVRGPLATILGLTQLIKDKLVEVDNEEIIDGILSSSIKLDDVIREIVEKTYVPDIAIPKLIN